MKEPIKHFFNENDKKLILPYFLLPSYLIIPPFLLETLLPQLRYFILDFLLPYFRFRLFFKLFPYFLPCLYRECMRKAAFHLITDAIMSTSSSFPRVVSFLQIANFGQTLDNAIYQLTISLNMMKRLKGIG